jgi:AraC-like DNA-binding protein
MIYNAYQDTDKNLFGLAVVSGGHIFAEQGRTISRPCGRDDFLLFYVAKGSEHILLDEEVELCEGGFVIFRPHEKQIHVQRSARTSEFYFVHFRAPEDFDLLGFDSSVAYFAEVSTRVISLFEEIKSELQAKQPHYEELCVVKLLNILLHLKRKCERSTSPFKQHMDEISMAVQLMNKEYEKSYSLENYAELCRMSKYHFLRVFKSVVGCSPIEYRNRIRLEHAKELLCETNRTVGEIAVQVGYASGVYFCNAFKARFGMSPSEYRRAYQ